MISNSSNINKKYNYLSLHIVEHKKTTKFADGNPGPGLGQGQNMAGLNKLWCPPPLIMLI
jgi:hypothetical protein